MDKPIETFCGIPIFEFDGWDEIDTAYLQFYKVNWLLDSMKKFNGNCVSRTLHGDIEISSEDATKSFGIKIIDIPEIRNMILARIPDEIPVSFD